MRNNAIEHSTEDRFYWYDKGENMERMFVDCIVPFIKSTDIIINPDKSTRKTSIDLLNINTNEHADLKKQTTPFFTASKYGFDPQYTITFNKKDYEYYKRAYLNSVIYFWVVWEQLEWKQYKVNDMFGVWSTPFIVLKEMIESNNAPLHEYIHRKNDSENAKDSYLFDLRNFNRIF